MAFGHGKSTRVFLKEFDISYYSKDAGSTLTMDTAETTVFGASVKSFVTGIKDAKATLQGLFDGTEDGILAANIAAAAGPLMIMPQGPAVGAPVQMLNVLHTSYQVHGQISSAVEWSAEMQGTQYARSGILLMNGDTPFTATGSAASQNNLAASASGCLLFLHVLANTINAVTDIIVEHSTNNSTWTTLAAFTQVPASTLTSQVIEVAAAAATPRQYVRATLTTAGTGSIRPSVGFARY